MLRVWGISLLEFRACFPLLWYHVIWFYFAEPNKNHFILQEPLKFSYPIPALQILFPFSLHYFITLLLLRLPLLILILNYGQHQWPSPIIVNPKFLQRKIGRESAFTPSSSHEIFVICIQARWSDFKLNSWVLKKKDTLYLIYMGKGTLLSGHLYALQQSSISCNVIIV